MTETTHKLCTRASRDSQGRDCKVSRYIQIVTPQRLKEILDADGDNYEPPDHFRADDEWKVAEAPPQIED